VEAVGRAVSGTAFPLDQAIETFPIDSINYAIEAIHAGKVIRAVLTYPPADEDKNDDD
jgi:Zn-dependent alcohol dehydrogenase